MCGVFELSRKTLQLGPFKGGRRREWRSEKKRNQEYSVTMRY